MSGTFVGVVGEGRSEADLRGRNLVPIRGANIRGYGGEWNLSYIAPPATCSMSTHPITVPDT